MNNQGKQTELVKRGIINYITDHHLKVGDRIPTQTVLRNLLGVGNAVIGRAIQSLTADGILENKGRGGIILRNTDIQGFPGRNIGIICHHDMEFMSMASFMQALSFILNQKACQLTLFVKSENELKDQYHFREFSGLERAIQKHSIDGLFSTIRLNEESEMFLKKSKMPFSYVGIERSNPEIPCVNFKLDIENILRGLPEKGFKRPMLIHMGHPFTKKIRMDFMNCCDLFDFQGYAPEKFCQLIREDASSPWDLSSNMQKVLLLTHQLTGMKPEHRPDVLVVLDDVIANWIALELKSHDWKPDIIHYEHLQMGFSWPLRTWGDYYQLDFVELAKNAVELLLALINGKNISQKKIELVPPYIRKSIG